jgi:hypothetical protein
MPMVTVTGRRLAERWRAQAGLLAVAALKQVLVAALAKRHRMALRSTTSVAVRWTSSASHGNSSCRPSLTRSSPRGVMVGGYRVIFGLVSR